MCHMYIDSDAKCLPDYDFRSKEFSVAFILLMDVILGQVLLFYKYYDPTVQKISYVGHSYETITSFFGKALWSTSEIVYVIFVAELMPFLRDKVGLPPNTPLLLYEVHVIPSNAYIHMFYVCTNFQILIGGETEYDRTN